MFAIGRGKKTMNAYSQNTNKRALFIEDKKTDKFVLNSTEWTSDMDKALSLSSWAEALAFCRTHHLSNVRILMRLQSGSTEVKLSPANPAS